MLLPRDDEEPLRAEVIRMASTYGRYGYRFIARMMRHAGKANGNFGGYVGATLLKIDSDYGYE
jgi:hypothetical protein